MTSKPQLKIGLFSIGLDVYWPQFAGLRERLEGYNKTIGARLAEGGAHIVNLGLIDTAEKAAAAGHDSGKPTWICCFCMPPPTRFPPRCCRLCAG